MGVQDRDWWRHAQNEHNGENPSPTQPSNLEYVLLRRELERQRKISRYTAYGQFIVTALICLYLYKSGSNVMSCIFQSVGL